MKPCEAQKEPEKYRTCIFCLYSYLNKKDEWYCGHPYKIVTESQNEPCMVADYDKICIPKQKWMVDGSPKIIHVIDCRGYGRFRIQKG